MTVHTALLAHQLVAVTTPVTLATVPAGETWIIKSVIVTPQGTGPITVRMFVRDAPINSQAEVVWRVMTQLEVFQWEGWVVALPGHILRALTTVQPTGYWVSGTRLTGVAP